MGLDDFSTSERPYQGIRNTYDKSKLAEDNYNLGYIVGTLLCDGSMPSHRDRIQLQASDKEFVAEFGIRLCNWLSEDWDGFNSSQTGVSATGPISTSGKDNWRIEKSSSDIVEVLEKYYNHTDWLEWIEDFNGEGQLQMLRGMWDSEGSTRTNSKQVQFFNIEDGIISLYLYLSQKFVDVGYNGISEITSPVDLLDCAEWSEMESRIKSGDVAIVKRYEGRAMCVEFPKHYTHDFFQTVKPTIKRKYPWEVQ